MMATTPDLAPLMKPVALRLLGEPNPRLSRGNDLRWGTHGSLAVDLEKGAYFDNEAKVGGGVLDLIRREQGCDIPGALSWLEAEGFREKRAPRPGEAPRPASGSTFYDYADEHGVVLSRAERRERDGRKTFLQHGPDGKGGFFCGKGCMVGVRRLPYRLAEAALEAAVETFPLADLSLWAKTPPTPKAFVMAGIVPQGEVTLATGVGGVNKSTFGLQLCMASAAALPMLGTPVASGPSLYVTAEDDDGINHLRSLKIAAAIGTTLDRVAGRLHVTSLRGRLDNHLATFDAEGKLRTTPAYVLLRATIAATKAKLVVLDNVAHLFAGNENDRGQVTAFVNLLYQLCRDFGCSVILIGHPNKAGDSYSGSTAWLNAVRSQIMLTRPNGNPDPDARELTLGKANYARADAHLAFRWHDFALIREDDLPPNMREELAATIVASGDNATFLACLEARTQDGLIVSPNVSPNYAPTQFEAMPAARGIGKQRLRAAMERLLALGAIEVFDHEKRGKGVLVKALRAVASDAPRTLTRTLARTLPERSPDAPEPLPRTPPHTHPSLKGETGAGLGASAPFPETPKTGARRAPIFTAEHPNGRPGGGPILAPGESADDPVPGWDD